jgi:hypothetical protein
MLAYDYHNYYLPPFVNEIFNNYRNRPIMRQLRNTKSFKLPTNVSSSFLKSSFLSSMKLWDNLPTVNKDRWTRNSFKYKLRHHLHASNIQKPTTKLNLNLSDEKILNKTRCEIMFKSHFFSHNFVNIADPSCKCGFRSQTTKHVLLDCPLAVDNRRELIRNINDIPNFKSDLIPYQALERLSCYCLDLIH